MSLLSALLPVFVQLPPSFAPSFVVRLIMPALVLVLALVLIVLNGKYWYSVLWYTAFAHRESVRPSIYSKLRYEEVRSPWLRANSTTKSPRSFVRETNHRA
jgi:hypothetical protein